MSKNFLITGGAGFIGSNYVNRLLSRGEDVVIFDNLSRAGAEKNLEWLYASYGINAFELVQEDIRNEKKIQAAAENADVIIHLAGQVAVTTSVTNPREDFEINALGTFNVLEAARNSGRDPIVLYASTNKVYGGMEDVVVEEGETRYYYRDFPNGISEDRSLDFHSPYGCSKGCGDQYVRDYSRIYNLPGIVFRQSCIYGPRQFGIEDQGWVAWFIIATVLKQPMSIFGDGKQVRDLLHVEDLMNAYDAAIKNIDKTAGEVFNIGGGSKHVMSVWKEFGPILETLSENTIPVQWGDWRPGDQRIYVSDIQKAKDVMKWEPKLSVEEGISKLFHWVVENKHLFQD
ncbi:MAG: CDP-paratose 2-epimerase [Chloroflexi bacterium HGW-Chloroflexi-10]|nr:MAG: CDP-paratose 2-epimerase [Chloroflexi bacterium HGW-Chloroflexi-10]